MVCTINKTLYDAYTGCLGLPVLRDVASHPLKDEIDREQDTHLAIYSAVSVPLTSECSETLVMVMNEDPALFLHALNQSGPASRDRLHKNGLFSRRNQKNTKHLGFIPRSQATPVHAIKSLTGNSADFL